LVAVPVRGRMNQREGVELNGHGQRGGEEKQF
jgi:hypothetical protein